MSKAMKYFASAALALGVAQPASAVSTVNGNIALLDVRSTGYFLITLSVAPTGSPSCATDTNKRLSGDANTAGGKAILAVATTAMTMGKSVYIEGTGACSQYPVIESIALLHAGP